jgi:hypothetical protein
MEIYVQEHTSKIEIKSDITGLKGDIELLSNIVSIETLEKSTDFGKGIQYTCKIIPINGILGYTLIKPISEDYILIWALCDDTTLIREIRPLSLNIFEDPNTFCLLAPDGLTSGKDPKQSYLFIAGGKSNSNRVFNTGWISQKKGSGIVFSSPQGNHLKIEFLLEYGVPTHLRESEVLVVQLGVEISQILGNYANLIKNYYKISLPPVIKGGYCTWYASYHPGAADEVSLAKLAKFAHNRNLTKYGFEVIQIDDMWQSGPSRRHSWKKPPETLKKRTKADSGPWSDFSTHRRFGFYPHGMKKIANKLKNLSIKPGIWLMPFAWDPLSKSLKNNHDWFVKRKDGKIYQVFWAGWCLDMSNPSAQEFLKNAIHRITEDWGFEYLKMDGLWSGMATKIRYPDSKYGPDDIGDAVFYDKSMTNIEIYRKGLEIVRESAKKGTFLLGCNVAQNFRTLGASMGLLDAMRIGRDIGANWNAVIPCIEMSSRLYFLNGQVWYNDPDCLMLRNPLTIEQAQSWASWIVLTGQLNIVSEWLPRLSQERLDVFLRSIPNTGLVARPLDILENDPARIWHLLKPETQRTNRRDIVGLFNVKEDQSISINLQLKDLKIPPSPFNQYIAYDYWKKNYVGPFKDTIKIDLNPTSCTILSILPILEKPQILSTSRHISQGMIDILSEVWDESRKMLRIKSELMKDELYIVNLYVPSLKMKNIKVVTENNVIIREKQEGPQISITLQTNQTCNIEWVIEFE